MSGRVKTSLEQRFWEKVDRRGPDECWPWIGSKSARGYGFFHVKSGNVGAHRVAWEIHNRRDFPKGLCGLHSCDNPPCVNPRHICPGTHGDNMRDCAVRGRRGSVLTVEQVIEIRRGCELRSRGNASTGSYARRFNVGITAIRKVMAGHTWKHIQPTQKDER